MSMLAAINPWTALFSLVTGLLLGLFYFAGLWWTVRRMPRAPRSLRLYFGSLFLRLVVVMGGFYGVVLACDGPHLLLCLMGFLAARIVLTRMLGGESGTRPDRRQAPFAT